MDTPNVPKVPNIALASLGGRSGPARFLSEVVTELKKVTWPTKAETMKLTAVVIVISVIVGLFIGGLDALFLTITGIVFK